MLTPTRSVDNVKICTSSKIYPWSHLYPTRQLPRLYLIACLLSLTTVGISSCSSPPTPVVENSPSLSPSPAASPPPPPPSQPLTPPKTPPYPTANQVVVNVYKIDTQCQELLPEKTTLAKDKAIEAAISKLLEERDSADFRLAGYRLNLQNGVATVDLRVAPSSKRDFNSLSSCEQLALFGGIRKTLTSNRQWQVKSVRFTSNGEEILL